MPVPKSVARACMRTSAPVFMTKMALLRPVDSIRCTLPNRTPEMAEEPRSITFVASSRSAHDPSFLSQRMKPVCAEPSRVTTVPYSRLLPETGPMSMS